MGTEQNKEFDMTRSQRRLYKKRTGIDLDKMNKAGFYDGMPGVFLDADGNQRIYEIYLTPENELLVRYGVHPSGVSKAFKMLIQENELTRAALMIAVDGYRRSTKRYQRKQRWKERFKKLISFFKPKSIPQEQTTNNEQIKGESSKMHVVKEETEKKLITLPKLKVKPMFKLQKAKQLPNGKIEVSYSKTNEELNTTDNYTVVLDLQPHPDFFNALQKLNTFLAEANNLLISRIMTTVKLPPAKKGVIQQAEELVKILDREIVKTVIASGVVLFGSDEHRACIITGKHNVCNTAVAMNSPKISENGDSFGFETSLFQAIDNFTAEVKAYVLERKSSQLNMFDQNNTEEDSKQLKAVV